MSVCNETKPGWRHLEAVLEVSLRGGSLVRVWEKFFWRRSPHSARRMGCGMRDAGSAAKNIFPELAQVSLLAGYKHREGLGQDEEWGGPGKMESSLSSSSPCSFFPVIPGSEHFGLTTEARLAQRLHVHVSRSSLWNHIIDI